PELELSRPCTPTALRASTTPRWTLHSFLISSLEQGGVEFPAKPGCHRMYSVEKVGSFPMSEPERPELDRAIRDLEGLLARARGGCQEAAAELVRQYSKPMQVVVRRRLDQRLRSAFDSLDFVQDAWKSFFRTVIHEETFTDPQRFVGFL